MMTSARLSHRPVWPAVAALSLKQNLRNPIALFLLIGAPVVLVFVLAEGLRNVLPPGHARPFFTVLLLTQACAFGAHLGSWGIQKHRHYGTDQRLRVAPLGAASYLAGTFLGAAATLWAFLSLSAAITVVLFQVDVGSRAAMALLELGAGAGFSTALGMLLALVVRSQEALVGIMNGAIPLVILASGGYVPIPDSGTLYTVSLFSPLGWVNRALAGHVGLGEPVHTGAVLGIAFGATIVILIAGWLVLRRKWR